MVRMETGVEMYRCQLGLYCGGNGKIEVHSVLPDKLVCVRCVAGIEGFTLKQVKDAAKDPKNKKIHNAKSVNHKCP